MSTGQPELDHGSNTAVIIRYLTNALYSRESSAVQLADLKKKTGKKHSGGYQVIKDPFSGAFFSEESICTHICPICTADHIK